MPDKKNPTPLRSGDHALEQETRTDTPIPALQAETQAEDRDGKTLLEARFRAMSCQHRTRLLSEVTSGGEPHIQGSQSSPFDDTLIHALKTFDDDAWELVFNDYQGRLFHDIVASLRRRGLNRHYADDIVGETWLTAAEKIADLECRDLETLYHWLRVISYNRVRNLARKKRPAMSFQDVEDRQSEPNNAALDAFLWSHTLIETSPEGEVEAKEQTRQLEQTLHDLSPRDRELWLRRHMDGHSPAQMAADFALKPRSISQALVRTRNKLRDNLVAMGVHP